MKNFFKVITISIIFSGIINAQEFKFDFNKEFNKDINVPVPTKLGEKAIFGDNSMNDYYQVPQYLQKMADSTVAFVKKTDLIFDEARQVYKVNKKMTMANLYIDPNEDFYNQNLLSFCSGAYVGKGYILSAGHCISSDPKADNYFGNIYAVFGWKLNANNSTPTEFTKDQVYTFTGVKVHALSTDVSTEYDLLNRYSDYSLSILDREPLDRTPLVIEKDKDVSLGEKVFTIGYPLGMAVKIDNPQDAEVKVDGKTLFMTNIDAFGGNSGGPVFDSKTNKIVGILVTGYGGEFRYELKENVSFYIVLDSASADNLEIDPKTSTILAGKNILPRVIYLLKKYDADISTVSKEKYSVVMHKGVSIGNREPMFQIMIKLTGAKVFNKGKLVRMAQDDYGTGVRKLPKEIKDLL